MEGAESVQVRRYAIIRNPIPTLRLLTAVEAISTAPCTMVERACTIAAAC